MTHEVALTWADGRRERLAVEAGETVLAAAEAAGVGLPVGCRTGACATCTGRLEAGQLAYEREPRALSSNEREAGYVLTCIATPTTDCEIAVGARHQAEMVPTPWK